MFMYYYDLAFLHERRCSKVIGQSKGRPDHDASLRRVSGGGVVRLKRAYDTTSIIYRRSASIFNLIYNFLSPIPFQACIPAFAPLCACVLAAGSIGEVGALNQSERYRFSELVQPIVHPPPLCPATCKPDETMSDS